MAWADNLLEASFRGVTFDILKTDDSADRALAEHAYPYVDGADIEDLGRGPRRISIEAFFWDGLHAGLSVAATSDSTIDSGYEARLRAFLEVLDQAGPGELMHPVFGSIKNAQVVRYRIGHEADNPDQAQVSIEFVESTPGNPFFDRQLAAQKSEAVSSIGEIARGKIATALANALGALKANNPLALFNDLRATLTQPLLSLVTEVQGVVLSGRDLLASPRAFCSDISSIVDGVLDIQAVGTSMVADYNRMKAVFGLFDVFGLSNRSSGAESISSVTFSAGVPTEPQAIAVVQAAVDTHAAIGLAMGVALVLDSESETATLTPSEIETIVNASREKLEAAIVAIRATLPLESGRPTIEALRDQALAVQVAAKAIIEKRPPLLDRAAPVFGNLRLQAHALYGDHTRAGELYRLNPQLRSPNAIAQGDVLHAFAS